jgi:hypothetical protein
VRAKLSACNQQCWIILNATISLHFSLRYTSKVMCPCLVIILLSKMFLYFFQIIRRRDSTQADLRRFLLVATASWTKQNIILVDHTNSQLVRLYTRSFKHRHSMFHGTGVVTYHPCFWGVLLSLPLTFNSFILIS